MKAGALTEKLKTAQRRSNDVHCFDPGLYSKGIEGQAHLRLTVLNRSRSDNYGACGGRKRRARASASSDSGPKMPEVSPRIRRVL